MYGNIRIPVIGIVSGGIRNVRSKYYNFDRNHLAKRHEQIIICMIQIFITEDATQLCCLYYISYDIQSTSRIVLFFSSEIDGKSFGFMFFCTSFVQNVWRGLPFWVQLEEERDSVWQKDT